MSSSKSEVIFDRRMLLVATGAAAAVAYLPLAAFAGTPAVGAETRQLLEDWTIDDMWGVYPRPHEPIGFGRLREDGELVATHQPVDTEFLTA